MREEASKIKNETIKIASIGIEQVYDYLKVVDVILVAPQIQHEYENLKTLTKESYTQVYMIDRRDYGMMNGKKVILTMLENLENDRGVQKMKILLVCSAGLSTSMIVQKMKEVAKQEEVDVEILAVSESESDNHIPNSDAILLGPQIRFKLNQMKMDYPTKPIEVIDMRSYGMMDGKAVLTQAINLMGANL